MTTCEKLINLTAKKNELNAIVLNFVAWRPNNSHISEILLVCTSKTKPTWSSPPNVRLCFKRISHLL